MCHFPPCATCDMRESSIFHSCLWSGFGELAGVWVNLSPTRIPKLPSKTRPQPDLTKLEVLFYQFGLGLVAGYFRLSLVGINVNPTRPTPTQPTQKFSSDLVSRVRVGPNPNCRVGDALEFMHVGMWACGQPMWAGSLTFKIFKYKARITRLL